MFLIIFYWVIDILSCLSSDISFSLIRQLIFLLSGLLSFGLAGVLREWTRHLGDIHADSKGVDMMKLIDYNSLVAPLAFFNISFLRLNSNSVEQGKSKFLISEFTCSTTPNCST